MNKMQFYISRLNKFFLFHNLFNNKLKDNILFLSYDNNWLVIYDKNYLPIENIKLLEDFNTNSLENNK